MNLRFTWPVPSPRQDEQLVPPSSRGPRGRRLGGTPPGPQEQAPETTQAGNVNSGNGKANAPVPGRRRQPRPRATRLSRLGVRLHAGAPGFAKATPGSRRIGSGAAPATGTAWMPVRFPLTNSRSSIRRYERRQMRRYSRGQSRSPQIQSPAAPPRRAGREQHPPCPALRVARTSQSTWGGHRPVVNQHLFSRAVSPAMRASFFRRVQPLSCSSRASASGRVGNCSV